MARKNQSTEALASAQDLSKTREEVLRASADPTLTPAKRRELLAEAEKLQTLEAELLEEVLEDDTSDDEESMEGDAEGDDDGEEADADADGEDDGEEDEESMEGEAEGDGGEDDKDAALAAAHDALAMAAAYIKADGAESDDAEGEDDGEEDEESEDDDGEEADGDAEEDAKDIALEVAGEALAMASAFIKAHTLSAGDEDESSEEDEVDLDSEEDEESEEGEDDGEDEESEDDGDEDIDASVMHADAEEFGEDDEVLDGDDEEDESGDDESDEGDDTDADCESPADVLASIRALRASFEGSNEISAKPKAGGAKLKTRSVFKKKSGPPKKWICCSTAKKGTTKGGPAFMALCQFKGKGGTIGTMKRIVGKGKSAPAKILLNGKKISRKGCEHLDVLKQSKPKKK